MRSFITLDHGLSHELLQCLQSITNRSLLNLTYHRLWLDFLFAPWLETLRFPENTPCLPPIDLFDMKY